MKLGDIIREYKNGFGGSVEAPFPYFPSVVNYDEKWVGRWMERARQVSEWSKDPSTKIGAVVVNESSRQELVAGYNGFPRGIDDNERLNDRETKYKYVVHAEMNCIYNACRVGTSLRGMSMFIWGLPVCSECAKGIIQVGITRVFVKSEFSHVERWQESWKLTKKMFLEAGVAVFEI